MLSDISQIKTKIKKINDHKKNVIPELYKYQPVCFLLLG